jgi:nucleoside-diphosphate-sugar epimerase
MSQKVKILVTGVTGSSYRHCFFALTSISNRLIGYIGSAVVDRFLARSDASSLDIRAIVRSKEKADKLREFGINPIVGSHSDENVMVKAASEVDVVIAMVSVLVIV